ncbi:MAG: carotenoid oxygenase family protein [Cyanobacteriota bacterium]
MTLAPGSAPSPATTADPSPGSSRGYDRADWASAFRNVSLELTAEPLSPRRGSVPAGLRGTLYRNGPGRLERGGQWVHHPFDGDGMVTAVAFGAEGVHLSNRFVRTEGWLAEEKAGRMLHRGVFGTQKPGGLLANAFDVRLKNIANTHVVHLGDQLLALWEASSPHSLDPDTLETRGLTLLDGVLKPGEAFSAHPRLDPGHHGDGRLVTFGVTRGPRRTSRLREFASDAGPAGEPAGRLLNERSDTVNGFAFLHDFALTPNWAIFLQNAIAFNPIPFALGLKGAAQCLASKPGARGHFWLIPRESGAFAGQPARILPAPEGFVFHHLNAWEEGENVVVESIFYADFPSIGPGEDFRAVDFERIPEGLLQRCTLDLTSGTVTGERLSERCCEFAMVNPRLLGRRARLAWMAVAERERGNDPLQAIQKLDLEGGGSRVWSAAPRGFVSEPLMVPRPGATAEDDGWVLVVVWNGARCASDLVILDAATLEEVTVLELPLALPHGLHGSFVSA